jgi:peptide/nickel transport system permease protein
MIVASAPTDGRQSGFRKWLLSDAPNSAGQARLGRVYRFWLTLSSSPTAIFGLATVLLLLFCAVFAPWIAPGSPVQPNLSERLLPPDLNHWFGTDDLGRDVYTRIIHGSRITVFVVAMTSILVLPTGLFIGTVAGYFGGSVDRVFMRFTDLFMALPRLVLALAFVAVIGPGIENAVIAIAATSWPPLARICRAETLTVRKSEYVAAAVQLGASHWWILLWHVVPMCISSLIVRLTLDMAGYIQITAGLGFLGLGAVPPSPEWGAMIATGREYVFDDWWVATFPGIAILLVCVGSNLLGDGLRDALDPRHG